MTVFSPVHSPLVGGTATVVPEGAKEEVSRLTEVNTAAASIVSVASSLDDIYFSVAATAYKVTGTGGTESSIGTHGLGAAPNNHGMHDDGLKLYMSAAGTNKVREFDGS